MLLRGLSWLKDKPVCQEANDLSDLVSWQGKPNRPELRMIERKQGTCWRKRSDMPRSIGRRADGDALVLKVRAWLALNHHASRIAEFADEPIKLVKRKYEPLW